MSNLERVTVTLTAEMVEFIKESINRGGYASSSEIVREALRDWRQKRSLQEQQLVELRADIQKGLDDVEVGRVQDFDAERIIEKGRERLNARSRSA